MTFRTRTSTLCYLTWFIAGTAPLSNCRNFKCESHGNHFFVHYGGTVFPVMAFKAYEISLTFHCSCSVTFVWCCKGFWYWGSASYFIREVLCSNLAGMGSLIGNGCYLPSTLPFEIIQGVPGRKVSILGGHSIGYSKQKWIVYVHVSYSELFHCTVHCTLYRRATRHVLTRVAKCIYVDGVVFENAVY
jgi:hypothetical protein